MEDFHATLVDNGTVKITLCQVESRDPSNRSQPWYVGQSSMFTWVKSPDLGYDDEAHLELRKALCLAALNMLRDLDLSDHPQMAALDIPPAQDIRLAFSWRTGCRCECSPGFPTMTRIWVTPRDTGTRVHVDVHVTVA